MRRTYLSATECAARFPRLVFAMRWASTLCETEAAAAIRDYRSGLEWSGEAVNHFGGTRAVLHAAITARHRARLMKRLFVASRASAHAHLFQAAH